MPYRKTQLSPEEYYHLYNRGNRKQKIFFQENDYLRFLFLILYFQSARPIQNISRHVETWKHAFRKSLSIPLDPTLSKEISARRDVTLIAFALMPNHFHLAIQERKENGISHFMQRISNAFSKYSNTRYENIGHVFQGAYKAVHIENNEQLLYLSAYIHRNPRELKEWTNKEQEYPWSSYQDYSKSNRWKGLLAPEIVLEQFTSGDAYHAFVRTSGAKTDKIADLTINE